MTTLRQRAHYFAYRTAAGIARALPQPAVDVLAWAGGRAFAAADADRRAMVGRHLARVRGPGARDREIKAEVRRAFLSYARYWAESFRLPGVSPDQLDAGMSYEGLDHLANAMGQGRGAIAVTAHLGGWDHGGAWLASVGFPPTAVVEPVEPPELFAWFAELRRSLGVTVVPLGPEAGTATLRALKDNRLVALVCDRDIGGSGIDVEFFGERTKLPAGPATLALRTGAPLLPMAIYFRGRRGHHGVVREPLEVARTGRFRDDVSRVTQAIARELETLVRRSPDQWHLFQPNWPSDHAFLRRSTRPTGTP